MSLLHKFDVLTVFIDLIVTYHPLRPPPESCIIDYISQTMAGVFCSQTARRQHYCLAGLAWDLSPLRPLRAPVTQRHPEILHGNLNLKSLEDACIFAAATTAFYGMNRTQELLSPSSDMGRYRHLILLVAADLSLTDDCLAYTLSLPSTKMQTLHKDSTLIP